MLSQSVQVFVVLMGILPLASTAMAQRGAGEPTGVARRAVKPQVVTFAGTVERIVTEDCKFTTGRAGVGTHFLMKRASDGKELNVHLGPAQLVKEDAAKLDVGKTVSVRGFRTDAMAEQHYNAVTIQVGDTVLRLRGENLRPRWAGTGARSAQRPQRSPPTPRPVAGEGVYFPEGDPVAGRLAVAKMQCHACHQIAGADFPPPVSSPPVPVPLGAAQASQPRAKLAESIIAPSHVTPTDVPNTVEGGLSRMADYNQCMSVRELIDMIAYIKTLPDAKIAKPNGTTGSGTAAAGAAR